MIEGRLVRLRPIQRDDLPHLRRWAGDPESMRHWASPASLVTADQFEADLAGRFATFEGAGYFIIEDPSRKPIGRIEFERLEARERSAEVMILIGEWDDRGQGYGSDAMVALLGYLFHQRDLHRVSLTVLAWNTAAIRSYEKVGFAKEGTLREDLSFDGERHDQHVMSILRAEFDARWASAPKPTAQK